MKTYKLLLMGLLLVLTISPIFAFDTTIAPGRNNERGIELIIHNSSLTLRNYAILYESISGTYQKVFFGSPSATETLPITGWCEPVNYTVCDSVCTTNHTETVTPNFNYSILLEKNYLSAIESTNASGINSTILSDILIQLNKTLENYETCLTDKAIIEGNYRALVEINNVTKTSSADIQQISTNLGACQSEKATLQSQITTLTDEKEDTKNQKWVYGIVGLAAGIFGTLWSKGFIGKPKARDPGESYNRGQAA